MFHIDVFACCSCTYTYLVWCVLSFHLHLPGARGSNLNIWSGAEMLSTRLASVFLERRCTLILAKSPNSSVDHHLSTTSPQTPIAVIRRLASTFFSRSRELNTYMYHVQSLKQANLYHPTKFQHIRPSHLWVYMEQTTTLLSATQGSLRSPWIIPSAYLFISLPQIRRKLCGKPTHLCQARVVSVAERRAWYAVKIWTVAS